MNTKSNRDKIPAILICNAAKLRQHLVSHLPCNGINISIRKRKILPPVIPSGFYLLLLYLSSRYSLKWTAFAELQNCH